MGFVLRRIIYRDRKNREERISPHLKNNVNVIVFSESIVRHVVEDVLVICSALLRQLLLV